MKSNSGAENVGVQETAGPLMSTLRLAAHFKYPTIQHYNSFFLIWSIFIYLTNYVDCCEWSLANTGLDKTGMYRYLVI